MPVRVSIDVPNSNGIERRDHADLEAQPTSPEVNHHGPQTSDDDNRVLSPTRSIDSIRRPKRSLTAKTYQPKIRGRQWNPGQEPGIDPAGSHPSSTPVGLKQDCDITVVEFSQRHMQVHYHDNFSLNSYLNTIHEEDTEPKCRWINVNGLSWDVISALGMKYKFHKLAVEDMINTRNRTKADFYSDHTFGE